jgi:hypothetical protein
MYAWKRQLRHRAIEAQTMRSYAQLKHHLSRSKHP